MIGGADHGAGHHALQEDRLGIAAALADEVALGVDRHEAGGARRGELDHALLVLALVAGAVDFRAGIGISGSLHRRGPCHRQGAGPAILPPRSASEEARGPLQHLRGHEQLRADRPSFPHATRDLARFAAETRFADIPPAVIDRVKLSILDGLGVCLHGSTLPWTQKVRDVVLEDGGKPLASVWNSGAKVGLTGAVLVNSTAGHAFEMDDIHKESIMHPNSLSVPTALALAEADPTLSGRDIVAAIAMGCGDRHPDRQCRDHGAVPQRLPSAGHLAAPSSPR